MLAIRLLSEGGADAGIGWLVWVVLLIFFAMVILGWLAATKGWLKKEEEPVHEAHGNEHGHAAESAHGADDLTRLEGIGPKVAQVLAGAGITSFAGLAAAEEKTVREALDGAGYKYMDPSSWPEQAALAAKGDFDGLKKLQNSLKGGRKAA